MNADNIKELLYNLRVPLNRIRETKDFVNSCCPLAFFTHKSGEDRNPSFGIRKSEGLSYYYCFTCSPYPQRLGRLVQNYWLMHGKYPDEAAKILSTENAKTVIVTLKDSWDSVRKTYRPLNKYVINQFPQMRVETRGKVVQCRRYLESRGIPEWVYNYCGVRFDPKYGSLIFPLTDCTGSVYVLRARSIVRKKMWTIAPELLGLEYVFPRLTDVGVFFNSHLVDRSKPVMIVEGAIDQMRLMSFGYFNVMASTTSALTEAQINSIGAGTVILGLDADRAGRKGHVRIIRELASKVLLFVADWGIVGKKDPGELANAEELDIVIRNLKNIS